MPIRNSGTLGGNVANGSPIGDSMPALIALGATVVLRRGDATRELPLEDLYLAYQKTALQPGEFVAGDPRARARAPSMLVRAYKISKRFDQDISAVFACFALTLDGARIVVGARIGCGGVAATPRRAAATEAALAGQPWDDATAEAAARALAARVRADRRHARDAPATGARCSATCCAGSGSRPAAARRPRASSRSPPTE